MTTLSPFSTSLVLDIRDHKKIHLVMKVDVVISNIAHKSLTELLKFGYSSEGISKWIKPTKRDLVGKIPKVWGFGPKEWA